MNRFFSTFVLIIVLLGFMPNQSFAQRRLLKEANKAYSQLALQKAVGLYLELLDKVDVAEAKIKLADCFRRLGNSGEAEYWYSFVVQLPEAKPIHKLYLGMALQSNSKIEQAKRYFDEYSRLVPDDLRGIYLAASCESVVVSDILSKSVEFYEIKALPSFVNSNYTDFAPSLYKQGFVFPSSRDTGIAVKTTSAYNGEAFLDLYYVGVKAAGCTDKKMTEGYTKPVKFAGLNTVFHDGPIAFSPDGMTAYITRTNQSGKDDSGIKRLKIYTSNQDAKGNWSEPKGLPFNSDEYSTCHASLAADGRTMYLASNMPGGFGGYDIYKSTMDESGRWMAPENMGPVINLETNEIHPFIHPSGDLFFSSDGHKGLGGYDIYSTKTGLDGDGIIANVGYPINSPKDDIGFTMSADRTYGFYTSNRNGGVTGDDIYSFSRLAIQVDVLVVDKQTGKAIENAKIGSDCGTHNYMTDADGKFTLELPVNKFCEYAASADGYKSASKSISTKDKKAGSQMRVRIELDSDKRKEVEIAGDIKDRKGNALSGVEVQLIDEKGLVVQTSVSDKNGHYKFMAREDGKYEVKANMDRYLVASKDVKTTLPDAPKTPTKTTPAAPINVDFNLAKKENKQITFVANNIYWDYGKADLRDESRPAVDNLLVFLKDNTDLVVEIGSHTDSRGSITKNVGLSQRRADAVVEYLVSKGIDRARISAKGYGATKLVNRCDRNVKCTEEEHQKNRRTEFTILGTIDGKRFEAKSDTERIEMGK